MFFPSTYSPINQKIPTYTASERNIAKKAGILNLWNMFESDKIAKEKSSATIKGIIKEAPIWST